MPKQYWAIIELHNDTFDCVRGPYDTYSDAADHIDRLKAYRAKNPVPLRIRFQAVRVYHPEFVGL